MQQPCSHYNAFCSSRYIFDYIAICTHALQNTKGEPITRQNEQSATAAQTRYPSSLPAATLHGTTQGFVLRLPSQPKSHATGMQPLQSVLQQQIHIHAAITLRFASTRCRTPRENQSCVKTNSPQPPHRRGTLHRCLQPLYTENTRFRSPASFPKQTPCNRHAAITMRFAAAGTYSCSHYIAICIHALQNTKVEPITRQNERSGTAAQTSSHFAWKNTRFRSPASPPKQAPCNILAATTMRFAATHTHSCSHVIAICTHALQNTKGEPITRQSERSATAAQTRYLLHRRLQPLYTENLARFRVPASSPTQAPCNIHATITMRFATSLGKHASLYAHGNKT